MSEEQKEKACEIVAYIHERVETLKTEDIGEILSQLEQDSYTIERMIEMWIRDLETIKDLLGVEK